MDVPRTFNEHPPIRSAVSCSAITACVLNVEQQNKKGPEPFGVRASVQESLGVTRLSASSTRCHPILISAIPQVGLQRLNGIRVLIEQPLLRQHADAIAQRDAHERTARCGSNAVDADGCGLHDGSWSMLLCVFAENICGLNREWVGL